MTSTALPSTRSRRRGHVLRGVGLAVASLVFLVYVLAPVAWLVSSSVQQESAITSVPPQWIPEDPTLDNFRAIFSAGSSERVT